MEPLTRPTKQFTEQKKQDEQALIDAGKTLDALFETQNKLYELMNQAEKTAEEKTQSLAAMLIDIANGQASIDTFNASLTEIRNSKNLLKIAPASLKNIDARINRQQREIEKIELGIRSTTDTTWNNAVLAAAEKAVNARPGSRISNELILPEVAQACPDVTIDDLKALRPNENELRL